MKAVIKLGIRAPISGKKKLMDKWIRDSTENTRI